MENNKICQWEMEDAESVCGNACMFDDEYCSHHVEESKAFIRTLLAVYVKGDLEEGKQMNKQVKSWRKIVEDALGMTKYKLCLFIKTKRDLGNDDENIINSLI